MSIPRSASGDSIALSVRPKECGRRRLAAVLATLAAAGMLVAGPPSAQKLAISSRLSPLNAKRPLRPATKHIILHTTEGGEAGSLAKVRRFGEAHYFVALDGRVIRIIDRNRIATHAGRSMWNGVSNLDEISIGIEVVGSCDRDINAAQTAALRELLRQLKGLYRLRDQDVLTHSQVAYGRPNRFHDDNHRGRKRCGMIFARSDVRRRLGLEAQPAEDPDVKAGRLIIADAVLQRALYPAAAAAGASAQDRPRMAAPAEAAPKDPMIIGPGVNAWSIARDRYADPGTTYVFPDGSRQAGDRIRDWRRIPAGTRVIVGEDAPETGFEGFLEIGRDGDTPRVLAGADTAEATTIYFFPSGLIRTGAELHRDSATRKFLEKAQVGTRILVGYTYGGYVRARRPPSSIAGRKWNYPSTFYRFPDGKILSGDQINDRAIPVGTLIFFQS